MPLVSQLFPPSVKMMVATPDIWQRQVQSAEEAAVRTAVKKRKREYRAGRHCAAAVLAQLGVVDFPLLNDSKRAPQWPQNIVGSLTHCDNFCCAVASSDPKIYSLGVDAEPLKPLPKETTPLICSENELSHLLANNLKENYWSAVIFSAKEAFYKAYFPLCREYLDFSQANIEFHPNKKTSGDQTQGEFVIQLLTPPHPALYNHTTFTGRFVITSSHILTAITLFKPV
ncbi:MAG: 4'-phosphopantetheinyl transferase superfamily protein [Pseudomonadales bacterium]|nr:4'-phosphopantetheinyl transferase superfamily protein [Pseudomonadales bacterium]